MLSLLSSFEIKVGERRYQFLCPPDSPVADVKLAACEILKVVGKIEDEAKANAEAQKVNELEPDLPVEDINDG